METEALTVKEVESRVDKLIGKTPKSSVRSYLGLNAGNCFVREDRGLYRLRNGNAATLQREFPTTAKKAKTFVFGNTHLHNADCLDWLEQQQDNTFHAVVTDPPYGLQEYTKEQQAKLRNGKGGVWRIPPRFDGHKRAPLPRFTTLTEKQLGDLESFFFAWGRLLLAKLVPGAHAVVASNPLLSYIVSNALSEAGLERRGEIIRLVMTMRGGDRPKAAHDEFSDVSVMPRSMWEPWLVYRKPIFSYADTKMSSSSPIEYV